jgi:putative ABC transport system permease protein
MIKNYIKIARRNLWKHKIFTLINVVGMAIAFCTVILLAMTAFYELSYDQFHEGKDSVFQLYQEEHTPNGVEYGTSVSVPVSPALKADFPELKLSRFGDFGGSQLRYQNKEFNYTVRTVDADFFKMFTFPILQGDHNQPLKNINDMVIAETIAGNIFGKESAVGKTIQMKTDGEWKAFTISAVIADAPKNSSLDYDLLARFEQSPGYTQVKDDWGMSNHNLFVQLPPNVTQAQFEQRAKAFAHKYNKDKINELKHDGGQPDAENEYYRLRLVPVSQLHFSTIVGANNGSSKFYPYLLLLISVFILFIATVNFINLSLGRAFTRAKEIGLRKVMGASRSQILAQFCTESVLICFVALILGVLLAYWALPQYKAIFNQNIVASVLKTGPFPLYFFAGYSLVALVTGGYPALLLSSYKIAQTVKGKISTGKSNSTRNSLMLVQFIISSVLIICTVIAWQQLNFLRAQPLGYNKTQVISIPIGNNINPERALILMKAALANDPHVVNVTGSDMKMGRGRDNSSSTSQMSFLFKGKSVKTHWRRVDFDYIATLQLQLLGGREFSKSYGTDSSSIMINQKMASLVGGQNVLGQTLKINNHQMKVIGIVKDFNFQSLRKEVEPLTMLNQPQWPLAYIFVRVQKGNLAGFMASVTQTWKKINPKAQSDASYLDENTDKQYNKEGRLSKIFISGAILTIIISCMGLFAIVVLVIGQRTKEIGIRKVLGAGIPSLVALISKDFLRLILISAFIASPIAWYVMYKWLQDFAYHITIHWWVFVCSGFIAITIAFVTISFQSVKAALANPVDSIKSD